MALPKITARGKLNGRDIEAIAVNPRDWFGNTWLIEIGCGYSSAFYVVEAGTEQDAIDTLADSDEYGHLINVDDQAEIAAVQAIPCETADDCAEYDRRVEQNGWDTAGNDSHFVDLENVRIYGSYCQNGKGMPWPCLYYVPDGISPIDFA